MAHFVKFYQLNCFLYHNLLLKMNSSLSFTSGLKSDSSNLFITPVLIDECSLSSSSSVYSDLTIDYDQDDQYDPLMFSQQQQRAGKQVIDYFIDSNDLCKWVVLFAQMQSGKTETFRFVAAEMLRLSLVKQVVIFSGNAETELKMQLNDQNKKNKFFSKYELYLEEILGITSSRERLPIMDKIRDSRNIIIVWGTELKKYNGPTQNTLFIWEESHHAQNVNQCPDAFLRNVGISADGDEDTLNLKGNYMLSISATPFSEFSDNYHENQNKKFYRMPPGNGYNSVGRMYNSGRIKSYKDLVSGLREAFSMQSASPKWAIVRASSISAEETVRQIASQHSYLAIQYDSMHECMVDGVAQTSLEFLKTPPKQNTVVLLKEMCRMGKELDKEHILFCFETAKNSKTDTILQGLLGRCCGYFFSENIVVYLPEKFMNSGELQRYIDFADGNDVLCKNGRNLKKTAQLHSNAAPIIQVRVKKEFITTYESKLLFIDIKNAFINGNCDEENLNSDEVYAQIKAKVISAPDDKFVRHNLSNNCKTYGPPSEKYPKAENAAKKIKTAISSGKPVLIRSSKGRKDEHLQVNLWVIKAGIDGLREGDVYVDCRIVDDTHQETIPKTTKREVFAHRLEDGVTHISNGGFSIYLRPETANSVAEMMDDLLDIVGISLRTQLKTSRGVHSNQDTETKHFKGICVNNDVLVGLQKDGEIYEEVLRLHGVQIKISKATGMPNKILKAAGLVRLTSVTW